MAWAVLTGTLVTVVLYIALDIAIPGMRRKGLKDVDGDMAHEGEED